MGTNGAAAPERGVESVEALIGHQVVAEPTAAPTWTRAEATAAKNAALRVYLGGARRRQDLRDAVRGSASRRPRDPGSSSAASRRTAAHGTLEMLQGLDQVPTRAVSYRGAIFDELDVEAVRSREPEVALIDELAHTNVPGAGRSKRWEDVVDLLAAGIEVITTVNIQHLESLNDVVAQVTAVRQRETVPDWVVELADQIELVDMSPYALRRRMLHGNVYPDSAKAELALQRYFTTDNLTALRELALMRVANQVDETLLSRWSKGRALETRERVLVCVSEPGDRAGSRATRRPDRPARAG